MADNAEVRLGANVGGLKSGMESAAASARDNLGQIGDTLSGLNKGAEAASTGVVGSFNLMSVGIGAAVSAITTALLTAVHGIHELQKEAESVEQLRQVFGVTSDEASRLDVALQLIGKSSSEYSTIALHLATAVKRDEERIRELGVATRDASGNLLPLEQLQKNAIATMQTYRAGVDQNMVALELWGRSAKDVYGFLKLTDPIMERAAQLQRELGIEMGPAKRAEIEAYNVEVRAMGVVWSNIREALGEALMPVLKAVASWFATTGIAALKAFGESLVTFANEWTLLAANVASGVAKIGNAFDNAVVRAQSAALQIKAYATGQWGEVARISAAANERVVGNNLRTAEKVVKIWDEAASKIAARTAGAAAPITNDRAAGGGRGFVAKDKGGKAAADERLAIWKDELVQMQEAQGYFNELSKAQEADFWRDKLALVTTNGDADVKLRRALNRLIFEDSKAAAREALNDEIASLDAEKNAIQFNYQERIRIAQLAADKVAAAWGAGSKKAIAAQAQVTAEVRKADEQQQRIDEIAVKRRDAIGEHFVAMAQIEINQRVALRQVSDADAIAQEEVLQNRLFAIRERALREQLALEKDPVKIAAINAQIEALELSHQQKLTEIHNKAELERKQYAIAAAQAVQDNFANLLTDLVSGTKNWRDAFKDAIKSLTGDLNRLASQQIAKQLFGPGTGANNFLSNIFGKIFGGGAAGGTDPVAVAQTEAATVLTTAGTDLTLSATALQEAAAALMTGGGGGGGGIFGSLFGGGSSGGSSMSGMFGEGTALAGYAVGTPYVPQDSLAIVHKGEAIIPAKFNRSGGINMGGVHVQVNTGGGAVDTRTLYQIQEAAARGVRIASMRVGG